MPLQEVPQAAAWQIFHDQPQTLAALGGGRGEAKMSYHSVYFSPFFFPVQSESRVPSGLNIAFYGSSCRGVQK